MMTMHKSTPTKAASSKVRKITDLPACGAKEREAMALALSHLTEKGIKPRMTLKEFAEFYDMDLRQVQSDAERRYLPLVPRTIPGRRELLQVNMVAYYARMYLDGLLRASFESLSEQQRRTLMLGIKHLGDLADAMPWEFRDLAAPHHEAQSQREQPPQSESTIN
jgi:hypothetical protein